MPKKRAVNLGEKSAKLYTVTEKIKGYVKA